MRTATIRCDGCGEDISDADSMPSHMLTLSSSQQPNSSVLVYAINIDPSIACDHHFCGLNCLRIWLERKTQFIKLMEERLDYWKESNVLQNSDNSLFVYTRPPSDVIQTWESECRELANKHTKP